MKSKRDEIHRGSGRWAIVLCGAAFVLAACNETSERCIDSNGNESDICSSDGSYDEERAALIAFSYPSPNTNQCIEDLGGILPCQELNALGLPKKLGQCCDGIRKMALDRCECNPAIDVVLQGHDNAQALYNTEFLCRTIQPLKWATVPSRILWRTPVDCPALAARRTYGCTSNDMQIDAARLSSIVNLGSLFESALDVSQCFDVTAFDAGIQQTFEPDAKVSVPYGVGEYQGYDGISEYLAISLASVNHSFWKETFVPDPSKPGALNVSADGKTWTQGGTMAGSFFDGTLPYTDVYAENASEFQGCETR
ncbi:MAG TPA: hypothetical protein VM580_24450, partial [Labilithrix sp.]|nr:hypothetical protein [Labilithrix sp.]